MATNKRGLPPLLPDCLPLALPAFGRIWQMMPIFGPLWSPDGELIGLELLSRLNDRKSQILASPDMFFTHAPPDERFRALVWQVELLVLMSPWLNTRQIPVSLNITRPLALRLLSELDVMATLAGMSKWVRLEISERFLNVDIPPDQDAVLCALQNIAPLWLDDFGAGTTTLSCLMSEVFEAVKVDRHLLECLYPLPEGARFLQSMATLARQSDTLVIVEGVEDDHRWQFVRECGIHAGQGWRWAEVPFAGLNELPWRLPPLTGSAV